MKKSAALFRLILWQLTLLLYAAFTPLAEADSFGRDTDRPIIRELRKLAKKPSQLTYMQKSPGYYTNTEWRTVIDSTWGEGLPTVQKLEIFDSYWGLTDEMYPSFHHIAVNWDSLYAVFRPEIAAGVSRGRFYAIMCQIYLALQDAHASIFDVDILGNELKPGVPLLVVSGYLDNGHFGAGLTPLPDNSLLVYQVVPDHPLGLESGDIVLGYHGIPWNEIYKDLLASQLPVTTMFGWGSSLLSSKHHWLTGAGMNWHLFDTIDVLKYGSNDTLHLSTRPLEDRQMDLFCTSQMPIPGVPYPNIEGNHVSWGVVDGTNIGYVYIWSWMKENGTGDNFRQAVQSLLYDYEVQGLIVDSRMNLGGWPSEYFKALEILFNMDQDIFISNIRDDPLDHYLLTPFDIPGAPLHFTVDQSQICDIPIAVLIGPASVSAGDMMPLQMTEHPMVRTFGLPTNSAIGYVGIQILDYPDTWIRSMTFSNTSMRDNPDFYLTHVGFDVDEEIWLTADDVRNGEDTVVKRAMEWIRSLAYAHDVVVDKRFVKAGSDTLWISGIVENPNQDDLSVVCTLAPAGSAAFDSCYLYNDGNHNDSAANDSVWGGFWMPVEEKTVHASIITNNLSQGSHRLLPNVERFTSVGPVVMNDLNYTSADSTANPGDVLKFKIALRNEGAYATAEEVTAKITSTDDFVRIHPSYNLSTFKDINAGEKEVAEREYRVIISPYANEPRNVQIELAVASDGFVFWRETFDLSVVIATPVAAFHEHRDVPAEFALIQNYPNPFNPVTTIYYDLAAPAEVQLSVYNIKGEIIETLVRQYQEAGNYQIHWDAGENSSGMYFYHLLAGEKSAVKKCMLMR